MVGYYGVDSLAVATTPKAEQPSIKKVKLNNEGTLNLSFMVTNKDGNAVTNMDYTILVLDKDTDNDKETQRLKIVLDGRKLTKKENTSEPITCSVTRYDTDAVSYTHLDVYKRQAENRPQGQYYHPAKIYAGTDRKEKSEKKDHHTCGSRCGCAGTGVPDFSGEKEDVYKRQIYGKLGTGISAPFKNT